MSKNPKTFEQLIVSPELPTIPGVAKKMIEYLEQDDPCLQDLHSLFRHDAAIATKLLKTANSPLCGVPGKIKTVEHAIASLGSKKTLEIALGIAVFQAVKRSYPPEFAYSFFWKRSVLSACVAQCLDRDAFTTALLQDIGIIFMVAVFDEEYLKIIGPLQKDHHALQHAEKREYGFTHEQIGAEVLKTWHFPESIIEGIKHSHSNEITQYSAIAISGKIAEYILNGYGHDGHKHITEGMLAANFGHDSTIAEKLQSICEYAIEAANIFDLIELKDDIHASCEAIQQDLLMLAGKI